MCRGDCGIIPLRRMLSGFAATGQDVCASLPQSFTVILAHVQATRQACGKYPSNGVGNDASTRVAHTMPETFSPSRAARQTGVPMSTLRVWAKQYAEFFSPDANPRPGTERRFTVADLEVLKAISQLRANGLDATEIAERLRQGNVTPAESIVAPVLARNDVERPTEAPTALALASTLADTVDRRLGTVDTRLQTVDTRLQQLESQRRLVMVALLGVGVGAGIVAAAVWLAGMMR